jgi:hypothetical protein
MTLSYATASGGSQQHTGTQARVEPALNTAVVDGDRIEVQLPTVIEDVVTEAIAHDEQRRETDDLIEGETRVAVAGEDGVRHRIYAVTRVGGQEVERELLADEVIRDPTDRVVLVGTAPGPVREAQTLLTALGYPAGPTDGVEGPQTHRALCAWRRLEGHEASRRPLQDGELEALRATTALPAADSGRGVTVDRACQVLYYRDDGQWQHVHQASTGADGLPRPGRYPSQRWLRYT